MSPISPQRNDQSDLPKQNQGASTYTGKDLKGLSSDELNTLIEQVGLGNRNQARSFISRTLHVNDVVAESCLRHLEEKLNREHDYRERILKQVSALPSANVIDHQQFLRDAFGVQGIVSKAILNHWRIGGS